MDGTPTETESAHNPSSSTSEDAPSGDEERVVNETIAHTGSDKERDLPLDDDDQATKRSSRCRKKLSFKRYLSSNYRDLLNNTICEVNGTSSTEIDESLPTSLVSGSHWTASEKELFFTQLSLTGPGSLSAIARAIGSKSEPEIRAYLLLLEQGTREADAEARLEERFSLAGVPAAVEIGQECGKVADRAAKALAKFVEKDEAGKEEAKYGDWWLIDEGVAEELDEMLGEKLGGGLADGVESGIKVEGVDVAPLSIPEELDANLQPRLPVPSASLLNPTNFLQLSRSVFMNSSTDFEANWHNLIDRRDTLDGPAIYRTAFDDFYNLAISLTRRLVQVTIFQSLSRLRASSDSRAVPSISSADVEAAIDVLGMKRDSIDYWAGAARRCGLEVYSEKETYVDGRPTGKNGVKLTLEEVESELELERSRASGEQLVVTDAEIQDLELDDDAFTEAESEHGLREESLEALDVRFPEDEALGPEPEMRGRSTKRKRALSPRSYDRAEDAYLEQVDRITSAEEENKLREVLKLDLLPQSRANEPLVTFKRARREDRPTGWKDVVDYHASWESHGIVADQEFEYMEDEGRRTRMQRDLVREAVQRRMQHQTSDGGSAGEAPASDHGPNMTDQEQVEPESESESDSGSGSGSETQARSESEDGASAACE